MNSALRRAGETLNFLIKLNSRGFVFCGAFLIAGGALVAIALSSPWPLLAIFPGLQLMFRLVRDLARSRYAELAKSDALRLGKSWQEIYGVVGRHFVVGPIEDATIDIIECLLQGDPDGVMFAAKLLRIRFRKGECRSGRSTTLNELNSPRGRMHAW